MAKQPAGNRTPDPATAAMGDAIRSLTEAVVGVTGPVQALAAGVGSAVGTSPTGIQTAAPFVDLTGTAAPAEMLTPDGAAAPKQRMEEEAKKGPDWDRLAGGFRSVFSAMQSVASLGGTPAGAISAMAGQIGRLTAQVPDLGGKLGGLIGGQLGGSISKLTASMGPYAAAAGEMIQTIGQIPQLFRSAAESVNAYVQAFSPMAASRYQRAWADLQAAIGEQLLPVLNAVTGVVRFFADSVAGMTPVVRPLVDLVLRLVRPFAQLAGDVFRNLLTVGGLLVEAFTPLISLMAELSIGPLVLMAESLRSVIRVVTDLTRAAGGLLGLKIGEFDGASFGKSAQTAQFSDTTSAWKKLVESTANQGRATAKDPVVSGLDQLKTVMENIDRNISDFLKRAGGTVEAGRVGAGVAAGGISPLLPILGNLARTQTLSRS